MYKIDDEFRPPGRVFMKATRESSESNHNNNVVDVPVIVRKSNLKPSSSSALAPYYTTSSIDSNSNGGRRGSAITTNLDDRAIQFEHEVKHEKTIEALITEYPSYRPSDLPRLMDVGGGSGSDMSSRDLVVINNSGRGPVLCSNRHSRYENDAYVNKVVRNKRINNEVLGSSMETTRVAQAAPDGHRRMTTHVVRKITTVSRAEESAHPEQQQDGGRSVTTRETSQVAFQSITDGGGPKKAKVIINYHSNYYYECVCVGVGKGRQILSGGAAAPLTMRLHLTACCCLRTGIAVHSLLRGVLLLLWCC